MEKNVLKLQAKFTKNHTKDSYIEKNKFYDLDLVQNEDCSIDVKVRTSPMSIPLKEINYKSLLEFMSDWDFVILKSFIKKIQDNVETRN